jgi:alanyl-tRNA synthetase
VVAKIERILDNARKDWPQLARLNSKMEASQSDELADEADDVKGVNVLFAMREGADNKTLQETMYKHKDKLKGAAMMPSAADGSPVSLMAGVTCDLAPMRLGFQKHSWIENRA